MNKSLIKVFTVFLYAMSCVALGSRLAYAMDNTVYIQLSGQISNFNHMDVISNNLANAGSAGYIGDKILFHTYEAQDVFDVNALQSEQITIPDLSQGPLKTTGRSIDMAISGPGFFLVRTADGILYTKKSPAAVRNNEIVDADGNQYLTADGAPLVLEEQDVDFQIMRDGVISVNGEERGVIGIVEFQRPYRLRKVGAGLFRALENAGPVLAQKSQIIQGAVQESNVNTVIETSSMIELQRRTQAATDLISSTYAMNREAVRMFSKGGN
jgi:flagellar basal-body rod protein FlgF